MHVQPHERVLRAYLEDRPAGPVADVIVTADDLAELDRHDVVRLERWTQPPPAEGTRLVLRLDNAIVARGAFVVVAGQRGMRVTELAQR